MKKNYIAPNAKSLSLSFEGIIARSGEEGLNEGNSLGNGYNGNDISGSNRRSIWGDE